MAQCRSATTLRATGRSRVQVLNAIKVRGPERDDVLRAFAK